VVGGWVGGLKQSREKRERQGRASESEGEILDAFYREIERNERGFDI